MHAPDILVGVVAAIFAVAAGSKSLDHDQLVRFLHALGLARGTARIAASVVFAEALIAVLLPIAIFTTPISIVATGLACAFLFVQVHAARVGINTHCGCFGFGDDRPGAFSVARAAFLVATCTALATLQFAVDFGARSAAEQWSSLGIGGLIGVATIAVLGLLQQVARFEKHHLDPLRQREAEI
jgi:hypothetical protein